MVSVGPISDQIFADWPVPASHDQLEEAIANFFADALLSADKS